MGLIATLRHIVNHPLNRNARTAALKRFLRWQIGSRLLPGSAMVPFVDETVLVVSPGMTGATMNIYTGLADLPDQAFVLHLLGRDDLFLDIGANVGVYTVLAAGVAGARVISCEPVPSTYARLCANIRANDISSRVDAHNIGLGSSNEVLRFTAGRDTQNQVADESVPAEACIDVHVRRLDDLLAGAGPTLIKLDVEGWESHVLAGAPETLRHPSLLGLIVEMNSSSAAFDPNERAVFDELTRLGFAPHSYDPFSHRISALPSKNRDNPNTIFLRNVEEVERRVAAAPAFRVHQHVI